MPLNGKQGHIESVKQTTFSFFVYFYTLLQCCSVGSCVRVFLPLWLSGYIRIVSHFLCPNGRLSSSLCVLTGPGPPLPTDAAPPTTAQCIWPAAPRDCPRTSLSLFPHSSSLVRRGREGNRYKRKKRSIE